MAHDIAFRIHRSSLLNGRLALLAERLASAKVVDLTTQPLGEVRFGATVVLRTLGGGRAGFKRNLTLVRVEEASVAVGKIGFIAPIARAIIEAKLG